VPSICASAIIAAAFMQPLPGILLAGVVLLTIALVVLMRTRWGQAHPLAKCAGLSLFAHLLLFCYACTTIAFQQPPGKETDGTINVRLADALDETDSSPETSREPWDKIPEETLVAPEQPTLDRAAGEPLPFERAAPELKTPVDIQPQPADLPIARRAPPLLEVPPPELPQPAAPTPAETEVAKAEEETEKPLDKNADSGLPAETEATVENEPQVAEAPAMPPASELAGENADELPEPNELPALDQAEPVNAVATVPRRSGDGAALPPPLRARVAADRLQFAQKYGATPQTEAAVVAALEWLAANQSSDGRWDADAHGAGRENKVLGHDRGGAGKNADTGITGLALLAFLAHGETHLDGPHRETVQHALEYLLYEQDRDGNLAGSSEFFAAMYCHGIATLALSEAYALSGDERLKEGLERAIRFTIQSQHVGGGWRYKPHDAGDMSQFGWQLMSLKSAEMGGLEIPLETRTRMARFLRGASSGPNLGLASYRAGDRISRTMTAEALVCRMFMNIENSREAILEGTAYVQEELPSRKATNFYYWYYGTLAMFQRQGPDWQRWNEALQSELLSLQRLDGERAGSWDPDPVWGGYGGRVYNTAMGALCLEVYYRYLPLYIETAAAAEPRWSELPGNPYRPR
jgi:hypothetical protein